MLGALPYHYARVVFLLRGGRGVRVLLLALRLLAATAARLLGPLLQGPLVQVDGLSPVDLQLLVVGLLVPGLADVVVPPAALYPLPQPLHHGAVLRYAHHSGGHPGSAGRVHAAVDAETAVGSDGGGGEVPHHRDDSWLLFWRNFFSPKSVELGASASTSTRASSLPLSARIPPEEPPRRRGLKGSEPGSYPPSSPPECNQNKAGAAATLLATTTKTPRGAKKAVKAGGHTDGPAPEQRRRRRRLSARRPSVSSSEKKFCCLHRTRSGVSQRTCISHMMCERKKSRGRCPLSRSKRSTGTLGSPAEKLPGVLYSQTAQYADMRRRGGSV